MKRSLLACTVCGRSVGNFVFRNALGEFLCAAHKRSIGCTACGSVNGIAINHHIPLCHRCNPQRIISSADQQAARQHVLQWFTSELGPHKLGDIDVVFGQVDDNAVKKGSYGYAKMASYGEQGGAEIHLASGLHPILCQAVMTHEYMHTLIFMNPSDFTIHDAPRLDIVVEEGACQLAAFLYLKSVPGPHSLHIRRSIEVDPSPVYGDGFRHMRSYFARFGSFRQFLDELTSRTHSPETLMDSNVTKTDEFAHALEEAAERHRPTLLIPSAQTSAPKPLRPSTNMGRRVRPIIRLPSVPQPNPSTGTQQKRERPIISLRPK